MDGLAVLLVSQRRVWVRVAAIRPDIDWELALLEVITGERPPGWLRQRWSYQRAQFVACAPAGSTVARWLTKKRISLPSLSLPVPLAGFIDTERRFSSSDGLYERLPWPVREWRPSTDGASTQHLHETLVAVDAPSFSGFNAAAGAFFIPAVASQDFSGRRIVVREQDHRARIEHVRVRPTEIVVSVGGEQLGGTTLSLSGPDGARQSLSPQAKTVRLPLSVGLGPDSLLALHRGQELLDRRMLDPSWRNSDVDVEVDAATRVLSLISGGERATVEFKRQLPEGDLQVAMKTIAAFANGAGGTLLFGVDNDGLVVGLTPQCTQDDLDRLTNMILSWVRPLPAFEPSIVEIEGKKVIAVHVAPGTHTPYGAGKDERNVRYYMRRGGTTFPATPGEIRAVVAASIPKDQTQSLRFPHPRRP
jgi:hypothetical protein